MIGYYPINPGMNTDSEDAFGARFFRTHFFDRMRQVCDISKDTPILEILLSSGQVLDISQIVELKSDYMLASVFEDTRDCERTYQAYIRYITIYRINVLTQPLEERSIGFSPHEPIVDVPPEPLRVTKKQPQKQTQKQPQKTPPKQPQKLPPKKKK